MNGRWRDQFLRLRVSALGAERARGAPEWEDRFKMVGTLRAAEVVGGHVGRIVSLISTEVLKDLPADPYGDRRNPEGHEGMRIETGFRHNRRFTEGFHIKRQFEVLRKPGASCVPQWQLRHRGTDP